MTTAIARMPALPALPGWSISAEARRKIVTFMTIGAVSTGLYLLLYVLLRTQFSATLANVTAQLVSTVFSTAANRRYTMGIEDSSSSATHHAQMIGVFLVGLASNALALDLLEAVAPDAGSVVEMIVLLSSGGLSTALRIAVMRRWSRSVPVISAAV